MVAVRPELIVEKMTALLSDDGEEGKQKRLIEQLLRVRQPDRLPLPELLQKRYFSAIGDDTQSHKHVEVLAVFCSPTKWRGSGPDSLTHRWRTVDSNDSAMPVVVSRL